MNDHDNVKKYIYAIDFSNIIEKLVGYHGWARKHANEACEFYRGFLFINYKYDFNPPPSEEIDEFWHSHILDTEQYHRDTMGIFGHYLHHYPYMGIDGKTTASDMVSEFDKLQRAYAKEFNGQQIYRIRGSIAKLLSFFKSRIYRHMNGL